MTRYCRLYPAAPLTMVLVFLLAALAACAPRAAQPTPTPTRMPRVVQFIPSPMPAETPQPPAAEEQPPVAAEPTAAPAIADVQTGKPLIKPATDAGISPFTGLRPADPAVLQRRPLAIKVANQASVNPQSGLSLADVVVESRVEFNETRYTAIYQSQDAARVGSIRSARLIDLELPAIFDAILCFSGSVEPVRQKLYQSDFGDRILEEARNGNAFIRDPNIAVPDNLFANTATLWNVATQRGWNAATQPTTAWVFSEAPTAGGQAATTVQIPYPRFVVQWSYDAAGGRWLRNMGGRPHIDRVTGQQLSAANVIMLSASHVKTLILEHGTSQMGANCDNCSIVIQLWGQGKLRLLRDGQVIEGTWLREGRKAPFRFIDAAGNDIPLKPGNSWIQVVANELTVTVQ